MLCEAGPYWSVEIVGNSRVSLVRDVTGRFRQGFRASADCLPFPQQCTFSVARVLDT